MQSGAPLPARLLTANAYLGALPIRQALAAGAQVVITGRCVDSAVTLGALMHEFGWRRGRLRPAGAGQPGRPHHRVRLPGHRRPAHRLGKRARLGAHRLSDRRVPRRRQLRRHQAAGHRRPGHAGRDRRADALRDRRPAALPAARRGLRFQPGHARGGGRASRAGAAARAACAPGPAYKVSATYLDGFRCSAQLTIVGIDAARKARRTGEAILERTRELFAQQGLARLHAHAHRGARLRRSQFRPACPRRRRCARRCCGWR